MHDLDAPATPIDWLQSPGLTPYEKALAVMDARRADILAERAPELVWLLEHPPLYTAGSSAAPEELTAPDRFPVFQTGRGGRYTYHGPGQRVVYLMLDLRRRGRDVRRFVSSLETWMVDALGRLGVAAEPRADRVGVWTPRGEGREDKIAAIGVRLSRWISSHGVALNVAPDLTHFSGITPCGIADPRYGVTSLAALGVTDNMAVVDAALRESFIALFGPIRSIGADLEVSAH